MKTILYMTGETQGDALGGVARGVVAPFREQGFEAIEVNCVDPNVFKNITAILEKKEIQFVISFIGIGRDIVVDDVAGNKGNLWDMMGIPFISAVGDSPAYYFDRHINPGPGFANIYTFRDHYELRKEFPAGKGMHGVVTPFIFDREPEENINFSAKAHSRLIFPKNSNNPEQLKALWKAQCPPKITKLLLDIADLLEQQMHNPVTDHIDGIVRETLGERGINIDSMTSLRLFFIAQLDDYLRRAKTTMVAKTLMEFPVEIHGNGWDYMDFSNAKCRLVRGCDYLTTRQNMRDSLGIIDLSPNTQNGFHDRVVRAYGLQTLCITNTQQCMMDIFGEPLGFDYAFTPDSLRERIADVLANPKDYVELGREVSRCFDAHFPAENTVNSFIEIAEMLKISCVRRPITTMQDYFMWPPLLMERHNLN